MLIQLQPKDVTLFWEGIKTTIVKAGRIRDAYREEFLNHALAQLLGGHYQAWVVYDDEHEQGEQASRTLYALLVTSIVGNQLFGGSEFSIDYLYAFRKIPPEIVDDSMRKLKEYARQVGCSQIIAESAHPRVGEILRAHSFDEFTRYKISV